MSFKAKPPLPDFAPLNPGYKKAKEKRRTKRRHHPFFSGSHSPFALHHRSVDPQKLACTSIAATRASVRAKAGHAYYAQTIPGCAVPRLWQHRSNAL
jgi:hypothetical protein